MRYLRRIVLLTLGLLSAGISTANDCDEAARSASGPTIGLNAAGPSVTVDVACHFTSATRSQSFTVSSSNLLMVAASLNGTFLTLDPGYVGSTTPGTATVTVSRGTESYTINVNVSSCVTASDVALLPRLIVNPNQVMTWDLDMSDHFVKTSGGALTYDVSSSNRDTFTVAHSNSRLTITGGRLSKGKDRAQAELILTARNDCGATRVQESVTVEDENKAPTIELPLPNTTLASHGYTTAYTLSGRFLDPEMGSLTYSQAAPDADVVAGSIDEIDENEYVLTVTTGAVTETTTDSIFVMATDPVGLAARDTLVVTVTPNMAPSRDNEIPDTELAARGATAEYALSDYFSDPDGTPADLTYQVETSEPDTVSAAIEDGELTVTTEDVNKPGKATITVTARDPGDLEVSDEFVVSVTVATPCRIEVNPSIPDVRLAPDGLTHEVTLANHFSGSNCGELAYGNPKSSASGVATAAIADGVLTVTSGSTLGTATITVEATGSDGTKASATFDVTVTPACAIDVTAIPDVDLDSGGSTHEVTLANHFSGGNCGELAYGDPISSAQGVATAAIADGVLTVTSGTTLGTATITVEATGSGGITASASFDVTVRPSNEPPTCKDITVTLTVRDEDKELEMDSYCTDQDDDDLTYALTEGPTGSAASITLSDGDLTIAPTAVGTATATVTASDGNGGEAISEVRVTVQNLPPETEGSINDIAVQQNDDDEEFSVVSYFSDPENAVLTYTANSSAPGVVTASMGEDEDAGTLTLSDYSAGTSTITVTATDPHQAAARQAFSFAVCGNPTASTIPHQALLLGADAEIDLDDYFSDPHGGDLSYKTTRTGVLVTLELSDDNTLTIESEVVGSATVSVTATNECGSSSDPQPIGVTVRGVPVAQGTIQNRTLTVNGSALSFDVASYFSEPDGDELGYSVSVGLPVRPRIPDIVSASMSGSTLTLTPLSTQGRVTVKVTATDSDGSASQSFVVTVSGGS